MVAAQPAAPKSRAVNDDDFTPGSWTVVLFKPPVMPGFEMDFDEVRAVW